MSIVACQNTCSLFQMYHLSGSQPEGNQSSSQGWASSTRSMRHTTHIVTAQAAPNIAFIKRCVPLRSMQYLPRRSPRSLAVRSLKMEVFTQTICLLTLFSIIVSLASQTQRIASPDQICADPDRIVPYKHQAYQPWHNDPANAHVHPASPFQ
jgi:hypothetical protein